jgi:hypothetical protein
VLIAAALTFGSGCARPDWIEQTLVTVDVTGTWDGSMNSWSGQPGINTEVRLELQQQGSKVTGSFRRLTGGVGTAQIPIESAIEGSVAGDVFKFKDPRGRMAGDLTVNGDEMKGQVTAFTQLAILLRRVDSSPRPAPR